SGRPAGPYAGCLSEAAVAVIASTMVRTNRLKAPGTSLSKTARTSPDGMQISRAMEICHRCRRSRAGGGKLLTVKGTVQNADWATASFAAAAAGQSARLRFRPSGCATWSTLKTAVTASDGTLSTTVRAYADGDYRWSYAGTATTAAAVSPADHVDVR
ncbi:hypothetical protein QZN11_21300, partial [Streptomyces gramineus]